MVDAGLSPRDPVRWWLAYQRERRERQREQGGQAGGQDIQVVDDGAGDAALGGGPR